MKSVYIHIPFCKNICSYCDFCKVFYNEEFVDAYLDALKEEVVKEYQGELIETLYIGGGTPSSLSILELKKLFEIINILNLSNLKEFTFEVNPEDIEEEKLIFLKENGVNRISIGHETANSKYLKALDRKMSLKKESCELVKKYFDNVSVDLMYGFHGQTLEEFKEDLDYVISLDVKHISCYSLILEEHTKLSISKYERLEDEMDASMYEILQNTLEKHGIFQYEISNFAKNGYESRHNLTYWNNQKYYGFGVGASGYLDTRYTNTRSITEYIKGNLNRCEEVLEKEDEMVYEAILGLRKVEGLNKSSFFHKFGCTIEQSFDIIKLLDEKLLEDTKDFIRIPKNKLYLENQILIKFLEVKYYE